MKKVLKMAMPIYRQNSFIIVSTLIVMLITIRVLLPSVILKELNTYLATFSPEYRLHIKDVDISFLRGAYRLEGVQGHYKRDHQKFLDVEEMEATIAWREMMTGNFMMDLTASGLNLEYGPLLKNFTEALSAREKVLPFKISRLDVREARVKVDEYEFTNLKGRITNLSPQKSNVFSPFTFRASVMDSALVESSGKLNLTSTPIQWDLDSHLQGPQLDSYAEAISEEGKVKGYVKHFVSNSLNSKPMKKSSNKHWMSVLMASAKETVASKISFSYDQTFKIDSRKSKIRLNPGIENTLDLK